MKANLSLILILAAIIGLGGYAYQTLDGLWIDQFNQKNIKPYESGSMEQTPAGSVTTEGFVNKDIEDWFSWKAAQGDNFRVPQRDTSLGKNIQAGKTAYETYCQICHGADSTMNRSGLAASKINDAGMLAPVIIWYTRDFSDEFLFLKIENGGTVMPRLGHIVTPDDRWLIIDYLRDEEKQALKRQSPLN